jgi:hypothetical protein
MWKNY